MFFIKSSVIIRTFNTFEILLLRIMTTHFNIDNILDKGFIANELDYERALIADRKMRLLAKENPHYVSLRSKLRDCIEKYEQQEWNSIDQISDNKLVESDNAEQIAEQEQLFIETRKMKIKKRLKELELTQANLAFLLGHKSKTHMSELINGIKPFTLKDLIIINRLLKIEIVALVPVFLSREDQLKVKDAILLLNKPNLKLSNKDFAIV